VEKGKKETRTLKGFNKIKRIIKSDRNCQKRAASRQPQIASR